MAEKEWIKRYFAPLSHEGARNMRDDVALLPRTGEYQIVTTDAIVEGVHFLAQQSPKSIAKKLVRVNVSDILAKGARPELATLTLGWPMERPEAELALFAQGLSEDLDKWGVQLLGGDTVASPCLFASLTLIGTAYDGGNSPVWQNGAKPGDDILLTGKIGGNIGLRDARAGLETNAASHYLEPHLPPLEAAEALSRYATAATDVSDGLLTDLFQMLDHSGVGGNIDLSEIRFWSESSELEELIAQCTAGDDYQIICAAHPDASRNLVESGHYYRIGQVVETKGLSLTYKGARVNLPETMGFEHGD